MWIKILILCENSYFNVNLIHIKMWIRVSNHKKITNARSIKCFLLKRCLISSSHFLIYFIFIVVQLQLSAFSPHPSTPPQPNPPPSPASILPLGFVHVSFILVPKNHFIDIKLKVWEIKWFIRSQNFCIKDTLNLM